jgi:hypothetical protein
MILVGPHTAASGSPAPDDLPQRGQVREDAVPRLRPAVRQPEARHHLIEHEQRTDLGGRGAKRLEESGTGADDSLERLHDDRGEGVPVRPDQAGRGFGVVERGDEDLLPEARRDARRIGHVLAAGRGRGEGVEHRVVVMPVVGAFEFQDPGPAGVRTGEPETVERRLRARPAEADLLGRWDGADDLVRELDGGCVEAVERGAARHLLTDRLDDGGMSVPEDQWTRGQHVVEVPAAGGVVHVAALPPGDDELEIGGQEKRAERPARQYPPRGRQEIEVVERPALRRHDRPPAPTSDAGTRSKRRGAKKCVRSSAA